MTVDEPGPRAEPTDPPAETAVGTLPEQPPTTRSEVALGRYRARMQRARITYAVAIALVVAAALAVAVVVYGRGEITHATLHTVAAPPPSIALQTPSTTLRRAWASPDATATGTPVWGGTVVTHDRHAVRGRNASTGAQTWLYTRTDRVVCDAVQTAGTAIAIFEHKGNCDEVTALDSGTGARKWTRTLDENGQPLNGRPAIQVNQYTILLTTPTVVYAIDPGSGIDRWIFSQQGCRVGSAVLGSAGVLISQACTKPDCADRKFCGPGAQLLLRDGNAGRNEDDKANPDKILWNLLGNSDVPVSADQVVSALQPDGRTLDVFDPTKGTAVSTLTLRPAPGAAQPIAHRATGGAEFVHVGDALYSLSLTGTDQIWSTPAVTIPSVTPPDGSQTAAPDLTTAIVALPTTAGIATLDGDTGKTETTYPVGAPQAGSAVFPLGNGFVVAGPSTTVYR